ncbi:MAG: putative rane transport protein [Ramlibacter sp.]|nr:putative rane transport protein [Ramlibacter sp.]MDB5912980.1 putative rane transport protein [Ramlibacter sp.]
MRAAVLLLSMGAFLSGCALRICDGLLPRLASDFSITAGTASRVVLSFAMAYGLAQLGFGPLGDRFGKARMVCTALFGCSVGALVCALAPGFDALVGVRAIWGIASAGVLPLSMAWVGDAVPYEQRQATLARLLLGTLSGMMIGQLAGGLFADAPALGWRGAFGTLSVLYLAVATLLLVRMRTIQAPISAPPGGRFSYGKQLGSVLSLPWARFVLAMGLAEGLFLLGPLAFLPAYLHQRFGIAISAASALIAVYAVGGLVYAVTAKHIVQRFGERRMAWTGGLIMGTGFLAWYLSPLAWLAAPVALAVGFGTYLFHNTLQTNATQMAPAVRGTAVSLFASCFFFGQALGTSWAGPTFDHLGPAPLLLVPAVLLPLLGWIFARGLQRRAAT